MTTNDAYAPTTVPRALIDVFAMPRAAAHLVYLPESYVARWIAQGRLRTIKVGGNDLVRVDQVAELAAGLAPVGRL